MTPTLASELTKAASKQTYYTIRLLADRERMQDAFRAYAYFRWVDDLLDAESPSNPAAGPKPNFKPPAFAPSPVRSCAIRPMSPPARC